jgi:hypothetical protein
VVFVIDSTIRRGLALKQVNITASGGSSSKLEDRIEFGAHGASWHGSCTVASGGECCSYVADGFKASYENITTVWDLHMREADLGTCASEHDGLYS